MSAYEESTPPGDPTQRLLTAMGRFQRQVAKARDGAPQEAWSDECMNQLISATEIALDQGWKDVVSALTETARVLQSYESADSAHLSVDFLADSYEILCLMIGDLIVGNVRSGVLSKWQTRHERALEDLTAAGIALVEDEEDSTPPQVTPFAPPQARREEPAIETPRLEDAEANSGDDTPGADTGWESDLPPLAPLNVPGEPVLRTVEHQPELLSEEPVQEDVVEEAEVEPVQEEEPAAEEAPVVSPEIEEALERITDHLVQLEEDPNSDAQADCAAITYWVSFLGEKAEVKDRAVAMQACHTMARLSGAACTDTFRRDGDFLALAGQFSDIYTMDNERTQGEALREWAESCQMLTAKWSAADAGPEPAPTPIAPAPIQEATPRMGQHAAPVAEPHAEGDSTASHLLEDAQNAVSRGATGDAKLLALQAAANIAQAQSDQAEARVHTSESRLQKGATAIEQARAEVRRREETVSKAELNVAEGEKSLDDCRGNVAAVNAKLEDAEGELRELDLQIRELQRRRDEAETRRAETEAELAGARDADAIAKVHLENMTKSEEEARLKLEDSRQDVKAQQRKRTEIELELEKAREQLTRQRMSCADIEQTINQISAAEQQKPRDENGDLLF